MWNSRLFSSLEVMDSNLLIMHVRGSSQIICISALKKNIYTMVRDHAIQNHKKSIMSNKWFAEIDKQIHSL